MSKKDVFFSGCLVCLLAACEPIALSESAPSVTHSSAEASNQEVDWTVFFRPWENGCLEQPLELENFFKGLFRRELILPSSYRPGVLSSVNSVYKQIEGQDGYWLHTVQIKGSYYGMPVSQVGGYAGVDNDFQGYFLELAVPLTAAKAKLANQNVEYRAPSGEYMHEFSEIYGQASVDGLNGDLSTTVISCDLSL